jgi:hypothetical protein
VAKLVASWHAVLEVSGSNAGKGMEKELIFPFLCPILASKLEECFPDKDWNR